MYQKDLNMSYLLDFYGEAIPPKQKEILSQYYDEDLSLSEIAENYDMSRQGARHLIKKGESQLLFLEEKLGLAHIHKQATHNYIEFSAELDKLKTYIENTDSKETILKQLSSVAAAAQKIKID